LLTVHLFSCYSRPLDCSPLSLRDALPICQGDPGGGGHATEESGGEEAAADDGGAHLATAGSPRSRCWSARARSSPWWLTAMTVRDRKSTRLSSSHVSISYAVLCVKKTNMI